MERRPQGGTHEYDSVMPVILRWLLRLGPTNPIAVRLVQSGSRRSKHAYIRSIYLATLIIVLLWSLLLTTSKGNLDYSELARAGAKSFIYVAYLQIGLICVLAPVFMAGAISQEANPKTWDILLTTPLSSAEIVLGNLIGRLIFILGLLFASLPLFALTKFFGGVPGRSIFASYLIAACAALLVGAIAIAISVSRLAGRRAVFAFYVAVVSYIALTWGVDAYLRSVGSGAGVRGDGVTWMTALNPFLSLQALLNPSSYPRAPIGTSGLAGWFLAKPITTFCVITFSLSTLLSLLSMITVRTGGLGQITTKTSGAPWYRRMFGLGAAGSEYRPPRHVWDNPIAWREAAARNSTLGRILARWSFIIFGGLFALTLVLLLHFGAMRVADFRLALQATVWAELAVITLVAVNMAATAVSREREDGTLDLILTTPITPKMYLTGKLRGLIAYLAPMLAVPVGTMLIAGLYVLTDGLGAGGVMLSTTTAGGVVSYPMVLPEAGINLALVAFPFIAFCVVIGLQVSLKSRGTIAAVITTVGVVGVISGILGLCAWQSGKELTAVGPVLSGLSPAAVLYAVVNPVEALEKSVQTQSGLSGARIALLIGCGISAGVYALVIAGALSSMVRGFDMTVRKLAGAR